MGDGCGTVVSRNFCEYCEFGTNKKHNQYYYICDTNFDISKKTQSGIAGTCCDNLIFRSWYKEFNALGTAIKKKETGCEHCVVWKSGEYPLSFVRCPQSLRLHLAENQLLCTIINILIDFSVINLATTICVHTVHTITNKQTP